MERNLIRNFLRKKLDKEEREVFHKRIQEDAFQEKVSEEAVRQYGNVRLQEKLDDIHRRVESEKRRRRLLLLLIFATLVALLTAVFWHFTINQSNQNEVTPKELFASYFDPYPNIFDQKGPATTSQQMSSSALKAYSEQDYPKAIRLFELDNNSSPQKNSLNTFYYGIALLANQQSGKALPVLEQLMENSNTLLPEESLRWYLALTYLAESRPTDARPLLEWVAAQKKNKFKQKEAEEILRSL